MKIDVFVSYHTETARDVADAVVAKLEQQGLRCWYAPRDAEGRFAGVIKRAIDRCGVFVVLLSKAASESPHVLNEIAIAFERRDAVILPLRITDEELSDDVEYYLHRFHWIDGIGNNRASGMEELTRRVLRALGRTTATKIETIKYDDGCVYTGEIVNGKRHGKGNMIWPNGTVYDGCWQNDLRSGKGRQVWGKDTEWAGTVYDGDWNEDKPNGRGVATWNNGVVYEGDFVDGDYNGKGKMTLPDGAVYEGDWRDDKRTGKGTYSWPSGDVYEGDWLDDERTGKGIYRWPDGDVYEGDFVDGARTGYGTHNYANGTVLSGRFKNNKYLGE